MLANNFGFIELELTLVSYTRFAQVGYYKRHLR